MKLRTLLIAAAASLITGVLVSQAQVPGDNSILNSVFTLAYDNSTMKPTYSATTGSVTPASSATDVCLLYGSATKTVKVRRVIFTGLTTSTVATNPVSVIKRSTVPTDGTSALATVVPYDSSFSSGTAVAESFTANPTVGTLVGALATIAYTFDLTTSVGGDNQLVFEFGQLGSPVVLRGTSQSVSVNLGAATVAGPIQCTFEWTEE